MTTHNLPAIVDKTVATVETVALIDNRIGQVRITFKDGTVLALRGTYEGYIILRFETPTAPAIVSAQTKWPGE